MKYNFDKVISRRGTNSYKWDSSPDTDVLPLWVADMDFPTAPPVIETLRQRVEHGIFGYVRVPEEYYQATTDWFALRHKWPIKRDWIIYTSGVVPAISAIIKAMTKPGDKVLVQKPVYNCFFSSIRNNGCEIVSNDLICKDRYYTIDFTDLEHKASDEAVKVMLLCNPHNPTGRVWSKEELQHISDICLRHNVFVISDEIHCELTFPEYEYTPYTSLSVETQQHAAVCTSPSKAFNIAGLQIANIIVADDDIRRKIDKAININEVCDVNPFGVIALIAAYSKGSEWLDALRSYLYDNYQFLCAFFKRELPQIRVTRMEGTYLAWIDCSALGKPAHKIVASLLQEQKVWLNEGEMYGDAVGQFIRINMACPQTILQEALYRIKRYIVAHNL